MTNDTQILLVGSEAVSALRLGLERAGFQVTCARADGEAITAAAAGGEPAAVVVDPGRDPAHGLDLVTYLRHRFPEVPLVFLGAAGADVIRRAAKDRGATACLPKPVGPAVVLAAIAGALLGAATEEAFGDPRAAVADEAPPLWGVVLAGGEGRRLLPLVRHVHGESRPKQYATLTGGRSLLGATLDRVRAGIAPARTVVSALRRHRRFLDQERIAGDVPTAILQPADRGTAPGVLLPVRCILARERQATVAVFPSDHFIEPAAFFMAHVADAARFVARHPERIVLIGVAPTSAETEYGWIEPGVHLGRAGSAEFWGVDRFVEKPAAAAARACRTRGALWNTFVLVARAATLLDVGRQLLPAVYDGVESVVPHLGTPWEVPALRRAYAAMPTTNLSSALLEHATPALAVSRLAGVRWCDWGSPRRVVETLDAVGVRPAWLSRFAGDAA
ncbi:MAG: response regulator [Candidatus Rokubacteria bacterium]|nr:response regulator [Candidatus Rokubacteria bacterium]